MVASSLMHVHTHICTHAYTQHTRTRTRTRTRTHTHTHTQHTHTHTHTHWQGVVWRGATVGRMYTNHTTGSAEAFRGSWFLLPSSASPWGGPTRCRPPRSGEKESWNGRGRKRREGRGEEREGWGREGKTCSQELDKKATTIILVFHCFKSWR